MTFHEPSMSLPGRARLGSLFAVSPSSLKTHDGQLDFAGNGVAYFPSQANDPACTAPHCDVRRICETMAAHSTSRDRATPPRASPPHPATAAATADNDADADDPMVDVVNLAKVAADQAAAAALSSPNASPSVRSQDSCADRRRGVHATLDYWGWQTCTEFGFYQTCDLGSGCFYTQGLNLLHDMDGFCMTDFGIAQHETNASIAATNAHYGADRPDLVHNATRIFYVNGDVDPWSGLSILPGSHSSLPTLLVPGASHHFWTHPSKPTDQPDVVYARRLIREQLKRWLAEP